MTNSNSHSNSPLMNESEQRFIWEEGELFYRHWQPVCPISDNGHKKAVFLFHRGHEHSARLTDTVSSLSLDDTHVFAWDARGHGQSPGRRGHTMDGFHSYVRDMDAFVRGVCAEHCIKMQDVVIIAHSVAAVIATAWLHDYNPGVRAAVLVTPAYKVRLYVPGALTMLRLLDRIKPESETKSYVNGRILTHDKDEAQRYNADLQISKAISNKVLIEMTDVSKRLIADAHTITTPVLMLQAGADWVVDNKVQDEFFRRLGSPCKQRHDIPGAYHAVFQETSRIHTCSIIRRYIKERMLIPHNPEFTFAFNSNTARTEALRKPLSIFNPKRWYYSGQHLFMNTLGRLSKGIGIGWQHGFDSGSSLDYVYENKARGFSPLGRLIDRIYLATSGWSGIRQRKVHLQQALQFCVDDQRKQDRQPQLVDIASGPGRYILDFIDTQTTPLNAICRDLDEQGLQEGRALAAQRHCTNVRYEQGDAFNSDNIAELTGQVNILVASGVYELFDDNNMVHQSIAGVHRALPEGGLFIYTNQPWHPQLELIARTLINRFHEAWIMRCRPQAEIDALVSTAGFEKVRSWSDRWGIFTVSVARKLSASVLQQGIA